MPSPLLAYLPLAIGIALALSIGLAMLILNALLGPRRRSLTKSEPFECGNRPAGVSRNRFNVKFYLVALIFLVFDVEVVFILPWAVCYRQLLADPALGALAFGEVLFFVGILSLALLYVLKRRVLEWGEKS